MESGSVGDQARGPVAPRALLTRTYWGNEMEGRDVGEGGGRQVEGGGRSRRRRRRRRGWGKEEGGLIG